jgi:hypothetical protein
MYLLVKYPASAVFKAVSARPYAHRECRNTLRLKDLLKVRKNGFSISPPPAVDFLGLAINHAYQLTDEFVL